MHQIKGGLINWIFVMSDLESQFFLIELFTGFFFKITIHLQTTSTRLLDVKENVKFWWFSSKFCIGLFPLISQCIMGQEWEISISSVIFTSFWVHAWYSFWFLVVEQAGISRSTGDMKVGIQHWNTVRPTDPTVCG